MWPYALMLMGMNANRSEDMLAGSEAAFWLACAGFTMGFLLLAALVLRRRDVRA